METEYAKRYRLSEHGKKTRKKAQKRLQKKGYWKEKMKELRAKAKEKGICSVCLKNKSVEGKSRCEKCIRRHKEYVQAKKN